MAEDILLRSDVGAVTYLTLNAPDKLNALSDALLAALRSQCLQLLRDRTQRVVVIRAMGKAFSAGHDLREMQAKRAAPDRGAAALARLFDAASDVMQLLARLPQPVIAEVHGNAVAAGCQLVASADLAIASSTARFGVNGVNIGLFCSTPMVALSRNLPRKQAFEMLVTGDLIPADRAYEIGLVNRVVSPERLQSEVQTLAEQIAGKLGTAVRIGKRAFYDQLDQPVSRAYAHTRAVMVENMLDHDTAEGLSAFLEKRQPAWTQ